MCVITTIHIQNIKEWNKYRAQIPKNQTHLSRNVSLTSLTRATTINQEPILSPEVSIASNHLLLVQPRLHLTQEVSRVTRRTLRAEILVERKLGHPDLLQALRASQIHRLLDELRKVLRGITVPVHSKHTDTALRAATQELAHPVQTLAWGLRVGDTGRDERETTQVWGEELEEVGRGVAGGHGGLAAAVGLVEAHDILDVAAGQDGFDAAHELVDGLEAPEHGHELDALGELAVRACSPVVGPGDGAVLVEGLDAACVVVGSAALGATARLASQRSW